MLNNLLKKLVAAHETKPATICYSKLSRYRQFVWHLVKRSQTAYLIEWSPEHSHEALIYHCEWPINQSGAPAPLDAEPRIMQSIFSLKRNGGFSSLGEDRLQQSVLLIYGLEHVQKIKQLICDLQDVASRVRYLLILAEADESQEPNVNSIITRVAQALNIPAGFVSRDQTENKVCWFALAGCEATVPKKYKATRSLALLTVYNEADIIEEAITHALNQGLDVFVVDDASTDGTDRILETMGASKRVKWKKAPLDEAAAYNLDLIMKRNETIALQAAADGYQWMMYMDADEIRCSPWPDVSLAEAFAHVEALGYNAVEFTVADFRFLRDQHPEHGQYESQLLHFEFGRRPGHFIQIKAWKQNPHARADLVSFVGHQVVFEGRRVFPLKFLLKHYPLRSQEQAHNKLYRDRFPRYPAESLARGYHVQYNQYKEKEPEGWNAEDLLKWDESFHSKYMIERLSGVGLKPVA